MFGSFKFFYYLCIVIKKQEDMKKNIIKFLIWSIVLAPIYYILFVTYSITPATINMYLIIILGLFLFFYFIIENKDDFKIKKD